MPLFFVRSDNVKGNVARFSGDEARHIRKVFRIKPGEMIRAFDEGGRRYLLTIVDETARSVIARVEDVREGRPSPEVELSLGVGIARGDRFDYILQKSTELGVSAIVPFISSRTVVRLDDDRAGKRLTRWKRIVVESVKQCGSSVIPRIPGVFTFTDALDELGECHVKIILYEDTLDFTLKSVLGGKSEAGKVALLIGPEGGFSKEEVKAAKKAGFAPAGLGKNILRVETAAIAAVSMVQYHFENL